MITITIKQMFQFITWIKENGWEENENGLWVEEFSSEDPLIDLELYHKFLQSNTE